MPHSDDVEEVHGASATPSYHHVATYTNPHQSRKQLIKLTWTILKKVKNH